MGYRLNHLDEPVLMAVPKPMQTEFDIHHRLESCEPALMAGLKLLLTEFGISNRLESYARLLSIFSLTMWEPIMLFNIIFRFDHSLWRRYLQDCCGRHRQKR